MSSQEQAHIDGFSRLILQETMGNLRGVEYSGIWISKDRHWLIAPTANNRVQLVPISSASAIIFYKMYSSLSGKLQHIIDSYNKYFKNVLDKVHVEVEEEIDQ